ncbi:MAG TPA: type II toxin-antitoxin system RelE/ParE family toxin [Verrucomicrobiae bacterium]|nr:type II toxin-antitoxin system RelE/ParE family toxin [Verrucomicrobiae bacterium]
MEKSRRSPGRHRPRRLRQAVYVLHRFQKKSRKDIQTPKADVDLAWRRQRLAEQDYEGRYGSIEGTR